MAPGGAEQILTPSQYCERRVNRRLSKSRVRRTLLVDVSRKGLQAAASPGRINNKRLAALEDAEYRIGYRIGYENRSRMSGDAESGGCEDVSGLEQNH